MWLWIIDFSLPPSSPWPENLQPSDFTTLCCRRIHLEVGRIRWQLRDYSKPLLEASELVVTGPVAMAVRKSHDPRGQRECLVHPGEPWSPASVTIVRHVTANKFFYELGASAYLRLNMGKSDIK